MRGGACIYELAREEGVEVNEHVPHERTQNASGIVADLAKHRYLSA
jgi:hypothetical protein